MYAVGSFRNFEQTVMQAVIDKSVFARQDLQDEASLGIVAPQMRSLGTSEGHTQGMKRLTGLLNKLFRLLRPFLIWFFNAVESKGFSSSKLQRSSLDTDIIAPQLSNSPQY